MAEVPVDVGLTGRVRREALAAARAPLWQAWLDSQAGRDEIAAALDAVDREATTTEPEPDEDGETGDSRGLIRVGNGRPVVLSMPHKRRRRTKGEMSDLRAGLARLALANAPVTCRQLFYLAVSEWLVDKTERGYQTVVRLCLQQRQAGEIAWEDVVDRTRWMFKPTTFDSMDAALADAARTYRRSLWRTAPAACQVWCESLSIAGVIDGVTDKWDVPLYPAKGYASHDFLRTAARQIALSGKPTEILMLGDYDPSGQDIVRFVQQTLREYADEVDPDVEIDFLTVAVTEQQIADWALPSHPAKTTDSRHRRYGIDQAVELEAIPPDRLRDLLEEDILALLDRDEVKRLLAIEAAERETLSAIAKGGGR
jgi:hypothetical protein